MFNCDFDSSIEQFLSKIAKMVSHTHYIFTATKVLFFIQFLTDFLQILVSPNVFCLLADV